MQLDTLYFGTNERMGTNQANININFCSAI